MAEGEVAVGYAMDRFDAVGRLNEPNLEEEVREIVRTLVAEAESADLAPLLLTRLHRFPGRDHWIDARP